MYMLTVRVYNQHNECECIQTFYARSKAAVSMMAGRWCTKGWGKGWRDALICTVRVNQFDNTIISWEIR